MFALTFVCHVMLDFHLLRIIVLNKGVFVCRVEGMKLGRNHSSQLWLLEHGINLLHRGFCFFHCAVDTLERHCQSQNVGFSSQVQTFKYIEFSFQRKSNLCVICNVQISLFLFVIIISYHKVKYDRPGECSPEKDCLR